MRRCTRTRPSIEDCGGFSWLRAYQKAPAERRRSLESRDGKENRPERSQDGHGLHLSVALPRTLLKAHAPRPRRCGRADEFWREPHPPCGGRLVEPTPLAQRRG